MTLYGKTDITQPGAWFYCFYTDAHAFIGYVNQPACPDRGITDNKHSARISVVAVLNYRDVNVDNVTIFQFFIAGDAVTDDMIDGRTYRLGESPVIQRGRDGFLGIYYI